MRIWLVEERTGEESGCLEALLRELEKRPGAGVQIVGTSLFQSDFVAAMRKLVPDLLDAIVLNERACPDSCWTDELFCLGPAIVVAVAPERWERFRTLAATYPITFVPPRSTAETLWMSLLSGLSAGQALAHWRRQAEQLQQRLQDRIIIERAKGILVQRLKVSEEEAYKRLRLLSRRQRRQIRDIAQSLLDTQLLFMPEGNGTLDYLHEDLAPHQVEAAGGREPETP